MMIRLLFVAVAGLLAVVAQAGPAPEPGRNAPPEDFPTALQQQIATREAIQKKADEAHTALHDWYATALDAVKKDAFSKGDLDTVLAADAERARMDRELTEEEKNGLPKMSRTVRDQYDQAKAKQAIQLKAAITSSLLAYTTTLEGLEKRLTQKGEIDTAIAVRTERGKMMAQLTGTEPASTVAVAPAPPIPPNAPPMPPTVAPPRPAAPAPPAAAAVGVSRENPAVIEVKDLRLLDFVEGPESNTDSWASVPPEFSGARVFMPKALKQDGSSGMIEFKVLQPGRVYAIVNFVDQGNRRGGWFEERWTEAEFLSHGWKRVEGVEVVGHKDRKYGVLTKVVTQEDGGRLRCNKYNPPYLLTFAP